MVTMVMMITTKEEVETEKKSLYLVKVSDGPDALQTHRL